MAIYSEFSHQKWWFPIATLNYQRVPIIYIPFLSYSHDLMSYTQDFASPNHRQPQAFLQQAATAMGPRGEAFAQLAKLMEAPKIWENYWWFVIIPC